MKQVLIVRKDLKMTRGKECAQAAHASMGALLKNSFNIAADGPTRQLRCIPLTPALDEWVNGSFTKICVSCDSEEQLLELEKQAQSAGLINCLITDSGRTEFHGVPTKTVLAIGPGDPNVIDKITGHLKLR